MDKDLLERLVVAVEKIADMSYQIAKMLSNDRTTIVHEQKIIKKKRTTKDSVILKLPSPPYVSTGKY